MTEPPKLRLSEAGVESVRRALREIGAAAEAERKAELAALQRRIVAARGVAVDCPCAGGGS